MEGQSNQQYQDQQQQQYYQGAGGQDQMHGMYGEEDQYDDIGAGQQQDVQENDGTNALNLQWVIGFNKDIDQGVHNLTTNTRHEIFYSAAHTGVIYDYVSKSQTLLQGHCNQITATACSEDKNWIVTADAGDDSMLVVWDSQTGTPIRTYLNPHPNGVMTIDMSVDNKYLVTLGNDFPQTISLWDWTNEKEEGPIVSHQFKQNEDFKNQFWVKFNPNDPTEIASNGKERVLFLNWEQGVSQFQFYSPKSEKKDFATKDKSDAKYTKTVFIPGSEMAVTGTDQGDILVWDRSLIIEGIGEQNEKRLVKIVFLNTSNYQPINILQTVHDEYLVCGNSDGTIRFYDFGFKLVAWFEDLNFTTVKSISFSKTEPRAANNNYDQEDAEKMYDFKCSDFLVTDENALMCMLNSTIFEEIQPQKKKGFTIMHGFKSSISAIAVHPSRPLLAIAGSEGFILIWDYVKKGDPIINNYYSFGGKKDVKDKNIKKFFTTMEFTPDGSELLIGQYNGYIQVIDPKTGEPKKVATQLRTSENNFHPITQLIISNDGKYFACCDVANCVSLFKKDFVGEDENKPMEWQFNGKIRSHEIQITSIAFGEGLDEEGNPIIKLFSIGMDRRLFEYDIYSSKMQDRLVVTHSFKIEQEAHPTSCIWYPQRDSKEGLLLTANDDYKMKVWNPSARSSRRTALGPTYGGEIEKLRVLNVQDSDEKYIVYSTKKKVIGLIKMPIDGNPNKTMGLIAHPHEVVDVCCSSDGRFVFTCGGDDLAVNMWSVDVQPIEQAIALGGKGIHPFINLIEGGQDGQTYQDIKDFFYYSMIRSKDENTTNTRKLGGEVPLDELPNLMRAMGYYPTLQEIDNMKDEVKFLTFSEKGEQKSSVDLDTFTKLFVNHRPVYGIGKNNIEEAFAALVSDDRPADKDALKILKAELTDQMEQNGEYMRIEELQECLNLLIGDRDIKTALPTEITSDDFAENILGFEEVDEDDQEDDMGQMNQQQMQQEGQHNQFYPNEVIPEEDI